MSAAVLHSAFHVAPDVSITATTLESLVPLAPFDTRARALRLVGIAFGSAVGTDVGVAVGARDGKAEGSLVGSIVGARVKMCVCRHVSAAQVPDHH